MPGNHWNRWFREWRLSISRPESLDAARADCSTASTGPPGRGHGTQAPRAKLPARRSVWAKAESESQSALRRRFQSLRTAGVGLQLARYPSRFQIAKRSIALRNSFSPLTWYYSAMMNHNGTTDTTKSALFCYHVVLVVSSWFSVLKL